MAYYCWEFAALPPSFVTAWFQPSQLAVGLLYGSQFWPNSRITCGRFGTWSMPRGWAQAQRSWLHWSGAGRQAWVLVGVSQSYTGCYKQPDLRTKVCAPLPQCQLLHHQMGHLALLNHLWCSSLYLLIIWGRDTLLAKVQPPIFGSLPQLLSSAPGPLNHLSACVDLGQIGKPK